MKNFDYLKIIEVTNNVFLGVVIIFLFLSQAIVISGSPDGPSTDIFGFEISHPPLWTSYIPYIGDFLEIFFNFFSLHALVSLIVAGFSFPIIFWVHSFIDRKKAERKTSSIIHDYLSQK